MKTYFKIFLIIQISSLLADDWQFLGLEKERIIAITVDWSNADIIYAGSGSNFSAGTVGCIFKSIDGGASWDTLVRGVTVRDIDIHPRNSEIIYITMGLNVLTLPGIIKSEDGGLTWTRADSGISLSWEEGPSELVIDPNHPDTMYTGTGGEFGGSPYKTIDGGNTWFQLNSTPYHRLDDGIESIVVDKLNSEHLYFGTYGRGEIYETDNGGNSWHKTGLKNKGLIKDIQIDPFDNEKLYAGASKYGFFMSNDYGKTWINNNEGIGDTSVTINNIQLSANFGVTDIFISVNWGDSGGVYLLGENLRWNKIGIDYSRVNTIVIFNKKIYAGCSGIYVSEISTAILNRPVNKNNELNFTVFPNPCNSVVIIKFNSLSYITLHAGLYDILGRRIKMLFHKSIGPGNFEYLININDLSSGIYIIRFKAGRYVNNKKILIMK